MIKNLLQHKIRKDILSNNKKINHKSFLRSMNVATKIPYLMSYHKKKLIFAVVLGIVSWTYSLHKSVYYWLLGLRPPHKILIGLFVDIEKPEQTVLEQSTHKITLKPQIRDLLIKVYYQGDKHLYFGIGRNYLFQVYKQMGLLEKPEEERSFWLKSQFHKKRNQMASGVGLSQFLQVFQQGFQKLRQKNRNLTEQQFLDNFMKVLMSKSQQILEWEKKFNYERETQFLKNAPGLSQKKQQMILNIMKDKPQITLQQLQKYLQTMGLRGASLSNKFLYYRTRQVWQSLKEYHLLKKIFHPTIGQSEKIALQMLKQKQDSILEQIRSNKNKTLEQFKVLYQQQLI